MLTASAYTPDLITKYLLEKNDGIYYHRVASHTPTLYRKKDHMNRLTNNANGTTAKKRNSILASNPVMRRLNKVNEYDGSLSCKVKASLYSGDTGCSFGCLGCGDCVAACKFGALSMDPVTGLPVVDEEKCTACGSCVKACPKAIIELRKKGPRGMREYVSCVNKDKGPSVKKACANACIGCGICQKTCTHDAITLENNVAYIDFEKCKLCRECEAMCPTGAIHGVNFPKPIDKDAIKARVQERQKKAREAAAAAAAAEAGKAAKEVADQAGHDVNDIKKEESNG